METQTRSVGLYGYPWRSSEMFHKEYPSAKCTADTKPSIGKSFTIDALLGKPDKQTNDRSKPAHSGGKKQPVACSLAFQRQMCSPIPTYLYTPNIVHSQPGYPTYYPPFSYQATFREGFFTQEMTAKFHHQPFKCKAGKLKRIRTSFTNEQLSRLEKEFSRQQYMVGSERFVLASSLQLTEAQVKVWFQNRRIKFRKQTLDQQQAKVTEIDLAPKSGPVSQGCDEEDDEEEEVFSEDSDVDIEGSDL